MDQNRSGFLAQSTRSPRDHLNVFAGGRRKGRARTGHTGKDRGKAKDGDGDGMGFQVGVWIVIATACLQIGPHGLPHASQERHTQRVAAGDTCTVPEKWRQVTYLCTKVGMCCTHRVRSRCE